MTEAELTAMRAARDALAAYQQADMDGVMVLVSRQAIDECLPIVSAAIDAAEHGRTEAVAVAWFREADVKSLREGHSGAYSMQVANVHFKDFGVPYYAHPPAAEDKAMTPEDALVEAVARALFDADGDGLPNVHYQVMARAAIAAARPAIEAEAYERAFWTVETAMNSDERCDPRDAIRSLIPEVPS